MRRVPDTWLFEPWRMPASVQQRCGITLGEHLAEPVVDLSDATRAAKARLLSRRAQPDVRAGKADIVSKHASRKKTAPRRAAQNRKVEASTQLSWEL